MKNERKGQKQCLSIMMELGKVSSCLCTSYIKTLRSSQNLTHIPSQPWKTWQAYKDTVCDSPFLLTHICNIKLLYNTSTLGFPFRYVPCKYQLFLLLYSFLLIKVCTSNNAQWYLWCYLHLYLLKFQVSFLCYTYSLYWYIEVQNQFYRYYSSLVFSR